MYKVGDTVRFIDAKAHKVAPRYYPPVGILGVVTLIDGDGDLWVQWPPSSTSGAGRWCVGTDRVELVPSPEAQP